MVEYRQVVAVVPSADLGIGNVRLAIAANVPLGAADDLRVIDDAADVPLKNTSEQRNLAVACDLLKLLLKSVGTPSNNIRLVTGEVLF